MESTRTDRKVVTWAKRNAPAIIGLITTAGLAVALAITNEKKKDAKSYGFRTVKADLTAAIDAVDEDGDGEGYCLWNPYGDKMWRVTDETDIWNKMKEESNKLKAA